MFHLRAASALLAFLVSCGKYSPAQSPDLWRPNPPKIVEILGLNSDKIILRLELPRTTVKGDQLEVKPSLICLFQEDNGRSSLANAETAESSQFRVACPLRENFVGSLRIVAEALNLKSQPSEETVFIYNIGNQPEAYISAK
jgi:hypothetical protein